MDRRQRRDRAGRQHQPVPGHQRAVDEHHGEQMLQRDVGHGAIVDDPDFVVIAGVDRDRFDAHGDFRDERRIERMCDVKHRKAGVRRVDGDVFLVEAKVGTDGAGGEMGAIAEDRVTDIAEVRHLDIVEQDDDALYQLWALARH